MSLTVRGGASARWSMASSPSSGSISDQLKPVAELDGSGNLVAQFIYGTKANVPDLVIRGGATYRIVSDQLGSPVLAINTANSSDIPFQATYAAFGDRTLVAGTDDWMPFGFAGGHYDPDTKLTRFGARDYDAKIGRWVSKDPSRFRGRLANFYVYVGNDPINKTDNLGLDAVSNVLQCVYDVVNAVLVCANPVTRPECGNAGASALGSCQDLLPDDPWPYLDPSGRPLPPWPPPTPPVPMCFANEDWNTLFCCRRHCFEPQEIVVRLIPELQHLAEIAKLPPVTLIGIMMKHCSISQSPYD